MKELLGLDADYAMAVLRHFKWNMDKIQNDWFEREEKLRKDIGIEFDKNLLKVFPHMHASLPTHN